MTDEEADALAGQARARAAGAPTPEQVREMAERALRRPPPDMTPEQIRALASEAIGQAWQVSYLLRRLAVLTSGERS